MAPCPSAAHGAARLCVAGDRSVARGAWPRETIRHLSLSPRCFAVNFYPAPCAAAPASVSTLQSPLSTTTAATHTATPTHHGHAQCRSGGLSVRYLSSHHLGGVAT